MLVTFIAEAFRLCLSLLLQAFLFRDLKSLTITLEDELDATPFTHMFNMIQSNEGLQEITLDFMGT